MSREPDRESRAPQLDAADLLPLAAALVVLALVALLMPTAAGGGTRTLQKKGIEIERGWYADPELFRKVEVGTEVLIRDKPFRLPNHGRLAFGHSIKSLPDAVFEFEIDAC